MTKNNRQQQAFVLRWARKIHRFMGATLFVFFFIVASTAALLGWKKNSNGFLLAETQSGSSTNLNEWMHLDSLHQLAIGYARQHISPDLSSDLDRIDVRHESGIVKFVFSDGFWGLQVDGATGALLSIERRRSDFIEKIHDGSIMDQFLGTKNGEFKLIYTSIMSVALLLFTITGFWLWYGPKRMRKKQQTGN